MSEEARTVHVKMARASQDDADRVIRFFQFVEEFMEYGTESPDDSDEPRELTDEQFVARLREMWGCRFGPAKVDAAWSRVVFGFVTLVENCCDPSLDYLEWKPEIKAAIEAAGLAEQKEKVST